MNQPSGHITDAQIENCVMGTPTSPDAQKLLDGHVADCESCLGRLLEAERIHLGLLEGDAMKGTPYPGCPAEGTLQELAAGICAPDTAERITQHAAHCDYCGPLLSLYLRELSDDVQGEDAALLAQLESATSKWQKKFIREHLVKEDPPRELSILSRIQGVLWGGLWPKLATAAAGIAVVAGGLVFYRNSDDLTQAQKLVAAAYGERRTTLMRFSGVPYAPYEPLTVERSSETTSASGYSRRALFKAKSALADKLGSDVKPNPQWFDVEGRIALFEGTPGGAADAEKAFEKAQAQGFDDAKLKIDLAASYFEQDSKVENPNLSRTIDLLNEVLKNPKLNADDRAVALFDLAIAYEKSELWDLGVEKWRAYLSTNSDGAWATEARNRLKDAEKKLSHPKQPGFKQPATFLQNSSTPEVQANLEPYQDLALSTWLPKAIENPSSDASKAVHQLAILLEQQHSDTWWRDFLKSLQPGDLPAVQSLSAAVVANGNDLSEEALQKSRYAAEWFAQHRNGAGELRAQFEEVYALQRELTSSGCLTHANKLSQELVDTQYYWLKAQTALEKATCANWVSDHNTVAVNVALSHKIANDHNFPELNLRITGLDASMKRLDKKYDEAWKEAVAGLHSYWQGSYSPERLFQFYAVMYLSAQGARLPHAAQELTLQAISIRQKNAPDDLTLKAVLYLRLANILSRQGEAASADKMSTQGVSLLKQIPTREQSARRAAFITQIETAELMLEHGYAAKALSEISSIHELLQMQDDFINLDFYRVLGNIRRQLQDFDAAVSAYENAIEIAERSLNRMPDDSSRVRWIVATEDTYRGLTQTLLAQKQDQKALTVWERFRSRSLETSQLRKPQSRLDIRKEIAVGSLPPVSEPHLIYASFEDSLQLWLIKESAIQSLSFPIAIRRVDLEQQVDEFVENCADPHSPIEKLQQQGEALYKLLLQPVVSELSSTHTVAIELDYPLAKLNMEALRSSDNSYFGETYSMIYSPGLLVENTLRLPLPPQRADSFLLVDASPENGTGNLPGHEMEQDSVSRIFPRRTLITPSSLNVIRMKQALRESVGFDFIGHAKADGTGTALVLNSSFSLKAADFPPGAMPKLRFAVFSACSSGYARNGLLDTGSLVRSFLAARVPNIIASHWNVDSESTAQFMKTFYARLGQGEPVATALHEARIQMRTLRNHPYYWAAFSLNGRMS